MKLAILGESAADEAALEILVSKILNRPVELVQPSLRARGWPYVRDILPSVIKHLHYQTEAEGLIVVVDSNDSTIHDPSHDSEGHVPTCRLCELRRVVKHTLQHLRSVEGRAIPRVAIGLAVPCIEAWYRCGKDPQVTEAVWIQARKEGRFPYTCNGLKKAVYGTDRPSLTLETQRAHEEALRLSNNLDLLEQNFPNGFGALIRELHSWMHQANSTSQESES